MEEFTKESAVTRGASQRLLKHWLSGSSPLIGFIGSTNEGSEQKNSLMEPEPKAISLWASWVEQNLPAAEIKSILEMATSVFEDDGIAEEWLNAPNMATDDKPPIALLGTKEGLLRVETLLHRIEYGVLA